MSDKPLKPGVLVLATFLCISAMPIASAQSQGSSNDHFAFGMEYDWTNMNEDFDSMTGLPLDEILGDIMQSADDAGIDLLVLEEITGTSTMVIDQYEDGTSMFTNPEGNSVEITEHVTELTIRHGSLADIAIITEWSDARAGWDLTISGSSEGLFSIDANYVEFRDSSGLIYGHDISLSVDTQNNFEFDLEGNFEAYDGENVMPIDLHLSMEISYEIADAESSVVYSQPSTIYQQLANLQAGDDLSWSIDGEGSDDSVDSHTGTFETSTGLEFEITGLPADEMGLPDGKWDVSASESVTDSGSYDEDYRCEMGIKLFEGTQIIDSDGQQIEVLQAHTSPLPWGMSCHMANLFYHSFTGSEDAATLEDLITDSTEDITESLGGQDESYESSDFLEVSVYARSQDDVEIEVHATDLDNDSDYEINIVMQDSDGLTQDADSLVVYNNWWGNYWGNTDMTTSSWGNHCVTTQLKDVTENAIVDSVTNCVEVPQQAEPSELVEKILEGFSESTIDNVMENFNTNLEYRLEDYEADIPYDDADLYILWDSNDNMVVGFQIVVTSEGSNLWYTLVGPNSDSYGTAPSPISISYFSGDQAIDQEQEIKSYSTLDDLVDLSQHNDDIIDDAIEESLSDNLPEAGGPSGESNGGDADDDSGLLPFISPAFTIAIIAIAGLVASMRNRKD